MQTNDTPANRAPISCNGVGASVGASTLSPVEVISGSASSNVVSLTMLLANSASKHGQMYADGTGPNWNNVPVHGQIRTRVTASYTLTNMVGPGAYFLSQGMSVKYDKCFGGPIPMREKHAVVDEAS